MTSRRRHLRTLQSRRLDRLAGLLLRRRDLWIDADPPTWSWPASS